jgi:hypothetical protein
VDYACKFPHFNLLVEPPIIKWGNCFSYFFPLKAGVRQGGVLSPILFSIYMDSLIDKISSSKYGCYISCINFSIIMYADDIVLLAPTVTGLQMLLLACENELNSLDMRLNTKKSVCLRFGTAFDALCAPVVTCNNITIQWTHSFRYLGVYFVTGRLLRCSFDEAKCKYYRAFNAIHSYEVTHETISHWLASYCHGLPNFF